MWNLQSIENKLQFPSELIFYYKFTTNLGGIIIANK